MTYALTGMAQALGAALIAILVYLGGEYVFRHWDTATPHERAVNACVQHMTGFYRWQRKQICELSVTNTEANRK